MVENKTYKYGMRARGFSIGCQPLKGLVDAKDDPDGKYFSILVYDRPLDQKEIDEYELDNLQETKVPNLKKIREQYGISQRKLSEACGFENIRQIEFWESGPGKFNKAKLESAVKVADILGCDVRDLMD